MSTSLVRERKRETFCPQLQSDKPATQKPSVAVENTHAHAHIYTHTHTQIRAHTHTNTHTLTHTNAPMRTHSWVRRNMCTHKQAHTHKDAHAQALTWPSTHKPAHIDAGTRTHSNTGTHRSSPDIPPDNTLCDSTLKHYTAAHIPQSCVTCLVDVSEVHTVV